MSLDSKLQQNKLPDDFALTEELLHKLGVSKAGPVLKTLATHNRKTWGSLKKLQSRAQAVEMTGDDASGKAMWDNLLRYTTAGNPA